MKLSLALSSLSLVALVTVPVGAQQADWAHRATEELRREEYRFSNTEADAHSWSAPNRAHGFRLEVSADGLEVVPRDASATGTEEPWKLVLATKSFGRVDDAFELNAAIVRATNEHAELDHGRLTEWFVNEARGLEHGWTIARPPRGVGPLWIGLDVRGDLDLRIDATARSGTFVDAEGDIRLRYNGLVVFDATGRELDARMLPRPDGVGIAIDDRGAVYPLTVDPLLTGPAWTVEGDQDFANLGRSVASAGDVNGDGFSDVIVGAVLHDNGQANEGRALVYLGSAAGLSTASTWTVESDQANGWLGESVATAGDVNGDGFSDVIVGAYGYGNGEAQEGRAFVYLGSAAGLSTSAAWTAESNQSGGFFGRSVATAGDVNGDGYSDVIVGAMRYDNGELNEGRAYVYFGSAAGLATSAAWTVESNQVEAEFGSAVASAGDVNGDGYDDVVVGAYSYSNGQSNEGRAYLYLGSAAGPSTTAAWTAEGNQASAFFGFSVATAGDVDGDGYSDVIVGAFEYDNDQASEGRAFVYFGSAAGLSTSADWTAESNAVNAQFGNSVATAGDINGDGYSDVLIGASQYSGDQLDEGRTYLYLGSSTGLTINTAWTSDGDESNAEHGFSVATAGDVNGDGFSDVIIGAYRFDGANDEEGRAAVYVGSAAGLAILTAWSTGSAQASAFLGFSTACAGDVNGDGYSDAIVGAYRYDNGATDEGRAFVYLGSSTGYSASPDWTAESDQAFANFGWSVASAGDVNGDGYDDVIVGANFYDDGDTDEGRAFVYLGSSAGLATSAAWMTEGDHVLANFGWSVASAGDVNGDGYGDVIVGAYKYDDGEPDEGRAFVYLGSSTGLAASASWTAESDQDEGWFGYSVACAGDVNADGYSDVIVGAQGYDNGQSNEGRALVYLGSPSGLGSLPVWTAEGDQDQAQFGYSVASAGDVNGDGFSDVIVGAALYDNGQLDEGRATVYLGSGSGLALLASSTFEANQAAAGFGVSVASAGDVNSDGYGDVIIGAPYYDNGELNEGRAFAYLGSSTGLAATASWFAESNQIGARFGIAVASAGDANGDGFSDVLLGASLYDDAQTDEGGAFLYLGNAGRGGWTRAPRQRQASDAAPIALLGRSVDRDEFRIRLGFARLLTGFAWSSALAPKMRLEWEVDRLREPLDGERIDAGAEQTFLGSPLFFNELVESPSEGTASLVVAGPLHAPFDRAHAYHWRARVRTTNPLFPVTPWVTIGGSNVTETKLRVGPLQRKR
jgi:hypothetical protein